MSAGALAADHLATRAELAAAATTAAVTRWRGLQAGSLASGWAEELPAVLGILAGAQLAAARQADPYLAEVLRAQRVDTDRAGRTNAAAFAGVASDGRPLIGLLQRPIVAALLAAQAGSPPSVAIAAGLATLELIVRTQVADAGRAADTVALVARPGVDGYTRMTSGVSCKRCAILAGRWYRWSAGFARHPRCDCVHLPTTRHRSDQLHADPRQLVDDGRVTGLTAAELAAITAGADPAAVVNALRGLYVAGGRRHTTESTTRRGLARPGRLMPDQILIEARGDRDEAIRLLRLHAYIR